MSHPTPELDALLTRTPSRIEKWLAVNPFILMYESLCAIAAASVLALAVGYVAPEPLRLAAVGALCAGLGLAWYLRRAIAAWWERIGFFDRYYFLSMAPWFSFPITALVWYLFDINLPPHP